MEISVIPTDYRPPHDSFPFPAPFILSSVEREWCRLQANKDAAIVFIKRRHLEENIRTLESETGMDESERNRFLDYWCSPSTRNHEEVRAERDEYFNLRQRVVSWMEKARPKTQQSQKSRIERFAEKSQRITGLINELFTENRERGPAAGAPVPPDEQ